MKIKTSELIGPAFDWAVAKCEGVQLHKWSSRRAMWLDDAFDYEDATVYAPSADWSQGGPIIEQECICLDYWNERDPWKADMSGTYVQFGPTPLIAAMRCYVASELGDEVDVPDELLE